MRRMYTEKQVRELADEEVVSKVVESLAGKDISIGSATISGDLSVSGKINNVANPSVKPIYWHGIEVNNITGAQYLQLNIVLLLDDDTPINSVEKLFNKIESLGTDAFINIDGFFNVDSLGMSNATAFYVHENQNIYLNGNNSSCERKSVSKSSADWITYLNAISGIRVVDRINKIN